MPLYNQWLQQKTQFDKWQAEQMAVPQPKEQPWYGEWNSPEYDPSWEYMVDQQTGQSLPGVDPAIGAKLTAAKTHQRKTLIGMAQNPFEMIEKPVESLIERKATEIIERRLAKMQESQQAQSFIQQNSNLIYQTDPTGNPIMQQTFDPQRGMVQQPALTPYGQQFSTYAAQEHAWQQQNRASDPKRLQVVAEAMAQRDALLQYTNQLQAELVRIQGGAAPTTQPGAPAAPQAPTQSTRERSNAAALASPPAPGRRPGSNHVQATTPVTSATFGASMLELMQANGKLGNLN